MIAVMISVTVGDEAETTVSYFQSYVERKQKEEGSGRIYL